MHARAVEPAQTEPLQDTPAIAAPRRLPGIGAVTSAATNDLVRQGAPVLERAFSMNLDGTRIRRAPARALDPSPADVQPGSTRTRRAAATVIRRAPGDEDDDDELDGGDGGVDLDDEPATRTRGRDDGPRWRSRKKESQRQRNWQRRGAERRDGQAKRDRGAARDRKHDIDRDDRFADDADPFVIHAAEEEDRRLAEQRAREAQEQADRAEQERQEKQRREEEQRQREEQERQRKAQERQRAEEEERRRKKAEKEAADELDSLKNWTTVVKDDHDLFKARANRHLVRLRAEAKAIPSEKLTFVTPALNAADAAITKAKAERTQKEAIDALAKVARLIAEAGVDKLAPLRSAAKAAVAAAVAEAASFRSGQQPGPVLDLARSLADQAARLSSDAGASSMMANETDIRAINSRAEALTVEIAKARADVVHFPLFTGPYSERLAQLESVRRAGITVLEMTTLMPLIPAAGGVDRAAQLVNLCAVARQPGAIGLAGLTQLLPAHGVDVTLLVKAIGLAKVLGVNVTFIAANCVEMQTTAATFQTSQLDWFHGMTWTQVTDLCGACTLARMSAFCDVVPGAKILSLLNGPPTRRLTAAQIAQYVDRPLVLERYQGMSDGAWFHVTKDVHFDPAQFTISGGHDEASFINICDQGLPPGVTCVRVLDPPTTPPNAIVKQYNYTLTAGTKSKSGTKTVITGLRAQEAAFRLRAEDAVWNALRRGRFFANNGWDGFDGVSNWHGIHDNGFVRTGYPRL